MYLNVMLLKKCALKIAILGMALGVSGCQHFESSLSWGQPQFSSYKVANRSTHVVRRYSGHVVNRHVVYSNPSVYSVRPYSGHVINRHVVYHEYPRYMRPHVYGSHILEYPPFSDGWSHTTVEHVYDPSWM